MRIFADNFDLQAAAEDSMVHMRAVIQVLVEEVNTTMRIQGVVVEEELMC